jgi:integrase
VVEQGYAPSNPVATLPRSSRRLYRSDYDTRNTPFLQTTNDVRRVFLALAEPYNIAFACGALAGLRTGEVLGLSWKDIDIAGRRIHVRQQMQDGRLCGLKDDEGRIVPLQTSLAPILAEWKLKTGGEGLLFKPAHGGGGGRPELGSEPMFIRPQTIHAALAKALKACGLPTMTWYQCTRHSYASLWVLAGHSIERLSKIMGHASVTTTEHYAHLKPDFFPEKDFDAITVDLSKPAGDVVSLPHSRPLGNTMATEREDIAEQQIA